jgi:hypothetical protein
MQITQIPLPQGTLIEKPHRCSNYSDCFHLLFHSDQPIQLEDCLKAFFYNWSSWIVSLMRIRNVLVKPFGLKTDVDNYKPNAPKEIILSIGSRIVFFEVLEKINNEVVLFGSDKHLDFWLSVILRSSFNQYELYITTSVRFNNRLGKTYFFLIRPFHKLIVRTILFKVKKHFYERNKNKPK